jgi:hypothetical protein
MSQARMDEPAFIEQLFLARQSAQRIKSIADELKPVSLQQAYGSSRSYWRDFRLLASEVQVP